MSIHFLSAEQVDARAWDAAVLAGTGNVTQLHAYGELGGSRRRPLYVEIRAGDQVRLRWLMYLFEPLPGLRMLEVKSEPALGYEKPELLRDVLDAACAEFSPFRLRFYDMVLSRYAEQSLFSTGGYQTVLHFGSIVLELQQGEAALRAALQKKMRNRINKAEKSGLRLEQDSSHRGLQRLYPLLEQTLGRSGVAPPAYDYIAKHVDLLCAAGHARLYFAVAEGRDHGASMELVTPKLGLGWLGATADDALTGCSNFMQWEIIRQLAAEGVERYDLGGVDPEAPEGSKGASILAAKRKYGGELVHCWGGTRNLQPVRAAMFDLIQRLRGRH